MRYNKEDRSLEFTENFFATFYNDWEQLFGKWNWYNLTLVEISLEKDIMIPGYEFAFIILGIGVRFRYNGDWSKTPEGRELLASTAEVDKQMAEEIKKQEMEKWHQMEHDGTL